MNITEIVDAILTGTLDPHLEGLTRAVRERQENKGRTNLHALIPGAAVRLVRCPKYLQGATGKVVRVTHNRIVVDLDVPCRRYHKNISCVPSIIEAL